MNADTKRQHQPLAARGEPALAASEARAGAARNAAAHVSPPESCSRQRRRRPNANADGGPVSLVGFYWARPTLWHPHRACACEHGRDSEPSRKRRTDYEAVSGAAAARLSGSARLRRLIRYAAATLRGGLALRPAFPERS